jgi:hypothetical protein
VFQPNALLRHKLPKVFSSMAVDSQFGAALILLEGLVQPLSECLPLDTRTGALSGQVLEARAAAVRPCEPGLPIFLRPKRSVKYQVDTSADMALGVVVLIR